MCVLEVVIMTILQEKIPETIVTELISEGHTEYVIFIKISPRLKGGL